MNHRTIGILVTNTDMSDFACQHPRDGQKFKQLLQQVRPDWEYVIYDCTFGDLPSTANECDGYVIGGSPASVNDDDTWIGELLVFIRALHVAKTPVVGCCFGHQAIAKALGGTVGKNPGGWGFGISPTHFSEQLVWMQPAARTLGLYAAHSEQVIVVPPVAKVIGGDDFCPAASLLVGSHFFTTEYHPEMTREFFIGLTHAFEKYIGKEIAEKARVQAVSSVDSLLFAEWAAKFLEMAQTAD